MRLLSPINGVVHTLADQVFRWAGQSPEHIALIGSLALVSAAIATYLGFQLGRILLRNVVRLTAWLPATTADVLVDAGHRLRTRSPGPAPLSVQPSDGSSAGTDGDAGREYLRIRPTSAEYDPETLVTALRGLHSHHRHTEIGPNWQRNQRDILEVLVATRATDTGVEFYVGGSLSLSRLAAILPYRQCGFDIDRVTTHPAQLLAPAGDCESTTVPPNRDAVAAAGTAPHKEGVDDGEEPSATPDGHEVAGDTDDDPSRALFTVLEDRSIEPVVYRMNGQARRRKDWMMRFPGLTDLRDTNGEPFDGSVQSAPHPPVTLLESLDELDGPAICQVVSQSFRAWGSQADRRKWRLEDHRDTIGEKVRNVLLEVFFGPTEHVRHRHRNDRDTGESNRTGTHAHTTAHGRPRQSTRSHIERQRLAHLEEKDPNATFAVNVRIAAVPTGAQSRREVAEHLRGLVGELEHFDGDYIHLTSLPSSLAERITGALRVRGARHRQRLRHLFRRTVKTPVLGHTRLNVRKRWPDLVCTPDELAAWIAIPSTSWLPSQLTEAVEHDPDHTRPLRRLPPSVRSKYVGLDAPGRTVGYLFTRDGSPDLDRPFRLPVTHLGTHALRQGLPGCGKTTDMAQDVLADHHATAGPTVVFTGPGGDLAELVMRAVALDGGTNELRQHVHWFPIPAVQPGLTVFDVRSIQASPDMRDWADAAGAVADKYLRVAEALMGSEAFGRAPLSTNTLRGIIAAGFDPACYPTDPQDDALLMPHRQQGSSEVYRFWQLEAQVDDLAELTQAAARGASADVPSQLPDVSKPRLARNLRTPFVFDDRTAANIVGGVQTRLRAVSNNLRLAALFDNTIERFGFDEILTGADADDIFVFDLSALTPLSQRAYAVTLLSMLDLQLRPEQDFLVREAPDEYLVNLHIDEAAQMVDTPEFGEFLDVIRNYNVGVNLTLQYPEQLRERGGERTYTSVLSNVQTAILGPGELSDEQAQRLCPADWAVDAFKAHVRDIPETHRLVRLPPQDEQTRPQMFELHRGPLPGWHPDANEGPVSEPQFQQQFEAATAAVRDQTQREYGLPAEESEAAIRERHELGVPAVTDALGLARDNLAAFLALMTRHAQTAAAVDSAVHAGVNTGEDIDGPPVGGEGFDIADNDAIAPDSESETQPPGDAATSPDESAASNVLPWVPVSEVYARFMTQIDVTLTDADPADAAGVTETLPDHETIATCMAESEYFETALANDGDQPAPASDESLTATATRDGARPGGVVVRLTPAGLQVATDLEDPGEGPTAGSEEHTEMLQRVQKALQRAGPIQLQLVTQDGRAVVDAIGGFRRSVADQVETVPLTVECEWSSSTLSHPTKPLQNLKKAQEVDAVGLFAVPAGSSAERADVTAAAKRLANILADPVNRARGDARYYVYDDRLLTFHGGGNNDGETVVRRRTGADDSNRTLWVLTESGVEIRTPDGDIVATIDDPVTALEDATLEAFPAYYTYDSRTDQYMVHEHGAHHEYDDREELEADWVPIKEPFIPEREFPVPGYETDTYAIMVVHDRDDGTWEPTTGVDRDDADTHGGVSLYMGGDGPGSLQPLTKLVEALETRVVHPPGSDGARRTSGSDGLDTEAGSPPPPIHPDVDRSGTEVMSNDDGDTPIADTSTSPDSSDDASEGGDEGTVATDTSGKVGRKADTSGITAFAEVELVVSPGNRVPFRPVYEHYEEFVTDTRFEPVSDQKFTAALQNHFTFVLEPDEWEGDEPVTSKGKWYSPWGRTVHCLVGIELRDQSVLDETADAD